MFKALRGGALFARVLILGVAALAAACSSSPTDDDDDGGGGGGGTNRAPVVGSITVTPTFGIADLQTFSFVATASDPDGDALTFSWNLAGNARTGSAVTAIFVSPGGAGRATVTVTDARGLTATAFVDFVAGSAAGNWTVTAGPLAGATFALNQNANGVVSGTFFLPGIGNGNTDPAQPGQIVVNGTLNMRVKVGAFTDFNMTGTMATTGRSITGTLQGSGFTGQPFTMTK